MTLKQADIYFQSNLYDSENPSRNWLHGARRDWVLNAIFAYAKKGSSVLEVGVGCGIYTRDLAKIGPVTGIDVNPDFVAAANRIPNVSASIADVQNIDYCERFDLGVCSEVIEHIPNSAVALYNIRSALKPGGVLILTTPNAYSTMELFARLLSIKPLAKLASLIYKEPVDDLGHINRLTRRQLETQIKDAGFTIIKTQNVALYLPVLAEFCGKPGRNIAKKLANGFADRPLLKSLLWTQCYVLVRK